MNIFLSIHLLGTEKIQSSPRLLTLHFHRIYSPMSDGLWCYIGSPFVRNPRYFFWVPFFFHKELNPPHVFFCTDD